MNKLVGLMTGLLLSLSQPVFAKPPGITATPDDFNRALIATSVLRVVYAEAVQATTSPPASLSELGYDESAFQSDLVSHVGIDPYSNAIMIGLTPGFGQNGWVALIPTIHDFSIRGWTCQTTVSKDIIGTSDCRGDLPYDAITQLPNNDLFIETLIGLSSIRLNYAESFQNSGTLPRSLSEIGVDAAWIGASNTDHVIVESKRRAILVGLSSTFGTNQWLAMIPRVSRSGALSWRCRTTVPASITGMNSNKTCRSGLATEDLIP